MKLGKCIDLEALEPPDITETGGATGEWEASSKTEGKFTATHSEGAGCGGTFESQFASAVLTFDVCGVVRVTVDAQAQRRNAAPTAVVIHNLSTVMSLSGSGGGTSADNCMTDEMFLVSGANPVDIAVVCGDIIQFRYSSVFGNLNAPELTAEFDVEVLAP